MSLASSPTKKTKCTRGVFGLAVLLGIWTFGVFGSGALGGSQRELRTQEGRACILAFLDRHGLRSPVVSGTELPLAKRRSVPHHCQSTSAGGRRLTGVDLILEPSVDIPRIAKILSVGKNPEQIITQLEGAIRAEKKKISLATVLPEIVRYLTGRDSSCDGFNCRNAVINWHYPSVGLQASSTETMDKYLNIDFDILKSNEPGKFGDVIVIRQGVKIIHAMIFISPDIVWHKPDLGVHDPWTFETKFEAFSQFFEKFDQIEVQTYRAKDGVVFPEPPHISVRGGKALSFQRIIEKKSKSLSPDQWTRWIIRQLDAKDETKVFAALDWLSIHFPNSVVLDRMVAFLNPDYGPELLLPVLNALRFRDGSEKYEGQLMNLVLSNADERVRAEAFEGIEPRKSRSSEMKAELARTISEFLKSKSPLLISAALSHLDGASITQGDLQAVLPLLSSSDVSVRRDALRVFRRAPTEVLGVRDAVVRAAIDSLNSKSDSLDEVAADVLLTYQPFSSDEVRQIEHQLAMFNRSGRNRSYDHVRLKIKIEPQLGS